MLFRKKSKFDLSEVLEGCRKNKPAAQRQLVEQYYVMAKKLCLRYAKNSEEADEMVDDGFLKILGGLHKFDPLRPFEPWLRQVMVNTAIDHYRKRQHLVVTSDLETAYEAHHDAEGLDLLSAEELLSLIQQLPPTYRLIFNMYAIDGYDHNEIAEQLGITSSTSRANLAKARAKLQKWVLQVSQSNPTNDEIHVLRKFDDRIRHKLDQLEPVNDAAAWNRIQSRLPATPGMWASVSWKKTGIALYMAGTTAALVLLWWNQEKLDHRNQELDRKVQQLLSGSEALPASVSKSESQGKATEKGTVAYPNGHLQGSGSSDGFQGNGSTSGAGKTAHPEAWYSVQANDSDRLLRVEQAEQPGIQQKTRKPKGKGNAIEAAALSAKENSPALGSGNKEQSRAPQGLDGIAAMEEGNPERTAGSASQKNINQMAQAQSPVESNALEQVAVNKPVTLDSVRRDSVLVVKKDTMPAAIRKLGSTKKSSFLANLIPRIGLDFSTDFESLAGPGLHAEFFLSPKFTASVGFIAYFPVKEQFRNEKDYNIRTGQNFLAEYGDHLPANFHEVEAIQVKTRVLEIPVRFRYFTPIDAHWQWLIGMGTHFNISAKQELNCEVHMDQGEDEFLSYSHTPAPGLFHNLEFSTGLEYRNGGLAFRITPYYQYNFTTLQYLDKVHLLGLNLGLYFKP